MEKRVFDSMSEGGSDPGLKLGQHSEVRCSEIVLVMTVPFWGTLHCVTILRSQALQQKDISNLISAQYFQILFNSRSGFAVSCG